LVKDLDKKVNKLGDGWYEVEIKLDKLRDTLRPKEGISWEDIKDKVTSISFVTRADDFKDLGTLQKKRMGGRLSYSKTFLFFLRQGVRLKKSSLACRMCILCWGVRSWEQIMTWARKEISIL
jgi:hypothetical protein